MNMKLDANIRLSLSPAEFKLVGLALAGKLKSMSDQDDASLLNIKMLEAHQRNLRESLDIITGAIEKEKGTTNE